MGDESTNTKPLSHQNAVVEPLVHEIVSTHFEEQQEPMAIRSAESSTAAVHPPHVSINSTIPDPSDPALRREYHRLLETHIAEVARDKSDVEKNLIRERWFTVAYNRMSRNKIWAKTDGPDCAYFDGTPKEYTHNQEIWPRGRNLAELSGYGQMKDFFLFMWSHTRPYKTVAVILLMSLAKPFQVAAMSWVAASIENDPRSTPLWLYFAGFYGDVLQRFMYWWYKMWVRLSGQRVQLRCVLLKKRASLPHNHPVAVKWSSGRFTGLLKDVDDAINGMWENQLSMLDGVVSMIYLLILCFVNLAFAVEEGSHAYGVYVAIFFGLGVLIMILPFFWFWMFNGTMQECETMVRDGQALYMSGYNRSTLFENVVGVDDTERQQRVYHDSYVPDDTAVKAYWLHGRTTVRAFFHRLAWQTNYSLIASAWWPFVAYFLLSRESFGTTNILIVLLSLKDLSKLSSKLLDNLIQMSRGCNVLRDIAELLNAKADDPALDSDERVDEHCESEQPRT